MKIPYDETYCPMKIPSDEKYRTMKIPYDEKYRAVRSIYIGSKDRDRDRDSIHSHFENHPEIRRTGTVMIIDFDY